MDATTKGVEALKNEIRIEVKAIFKMNMKFEDWSVPEVDNKKAAGQILDVMQKALDELKDEVESGKYDNY
ncbi:hypothetical protein HUE87_06410 [Candidatus Sulfurimonas marisnigri]|uniref:Uncharacterized protein n=1 Tax=Candidatus Sulfurimonas marisnigri TaxID=2740405 RepID=A0A7S7LY69_9BACT|nr:hypothetical protein [Candidatus Sulfurimonas marisnigri]QOY53556.1 hypothetical protein HUE87_06410 [Candidatus Sulfurimonas marisnigri]